VQFGVAVEPADGDVEQPQGAGAAVAQAAVVGEDAFTQSEVVGVRAAADQPSSMMAWLTMRVSAAWMASPLSQAPPPRQAQAVSRCAGAAITPISGMSPSMQASEMQKRPPPRA
jgi:hypothetical protein